ncbi:hypothetical protein ACWD6K_21905 [Streptomyces sp. NPDC002431]
MYQSSSSMFASVNRHFSEPAVAESVILTIPTDIEGADPIRLTATEMYEALYGPASNSQFAAAVWRAALHTAVGDLTPHGTGKLLVIWLALPRLTGTVRRVCARLRADRADVEAEMVLALLERLAERNVSDDISESSLLHAARARAWRFARDGLREFPSIYVEHMAQDHALVTSSDESDAPAENGLAVQVDRPDGPDGPAATLRFRVSPERLLKNGFRSTKGESKDVPEHHTPRKKRRPGRRTSTRPVRPAGRRA